MKFQVHHIDPKRLDGAIDRDMQGWTEIEADEPASAAEEFLRDCWETDPAILPGGTGMVRIWVRQPDRADIRFDVGINWSPSFYAVTSRVEKKRYADDG